MVVRTREVYLTLQGDVVIGDVQDEGAPIIKLSFHNEATRLTNEQKLMIAQTVVRQYAEMGVVNDVH